MMCAAVHVAVCGSARGRAPTSVRLWVRQCERQCTAVWQCSNVQQCVSVNIFK
jgi:hypothetical protein